MSTKLNFSDLFYLGTNPLPNYVVAKYFVPTIKISIVFGCYTQKRRLLKKEQSNLLRILKLY